MASADALADEIVAKERQTWDALKSSGREMLPFLTDDCLMIFPGATIFSQNSVPSLREVLEREDMKPWASYEFHNVHVLPLGNEAASISYNVLAFREDVRYDALITSIWRRKGEDWLMCVHQQTLGVL